MAAASNESKYFEFEIEAVRESFGRSSNAETMANELMWVALARMPLQKQGNFALLRQ
ncbi:hypothetical protein Dsin_008702 [Dipteronia sinensis]|uniref:Uncharacterized protein n=1 Tax=Dipteronia sinensis TaxID=43782 RepID=A0AAE0EBE5_9ROSI|nr:hypothetical protein Dsin_008702 [Dipteronia sinensis]